ncbi:MAG: glycosyltransferase family 39 protein [Candidatus Eisenbacteria bacterium]
MTRLERAWLWVLGAFLLVALAFRISVTPTRFLDVDELEHLNAAYAVAHGESLYGSLFENHPPLLYWSLQPLARSGLGAEPLIRAARWAMLAPCLGILLITALVTRRLAGVTGALLAPLLLLTSAYFFEKGVEVRPDVPGAFFLLLGIWLLARRGRVAWSAAGVAFGLALFFTPKALFAAVGALFGRLLSDRARDSKSFAAAAPIVWTLLGGAIVSSMILAVLASTGALRGFWHDCIGTSAHMTIDDPWGTRWGLLGGAILKANPVTWVLGAIGVGQLLRSREVLPECPPRTMIPCSLLAALAGFFLMNAPLRQYFLFVLPALAITAAWASHRVVLAIGASFRGVAFRVALPLALLVPPCVALLPVQRQGVEVEVLRTVLRATRPEDRVLDLWSGLYLTRLPAYRYFFLNSDVIRLLPPGKLESELLGVLDDPRVRAVIVDDHFRLLPASVRQRIRSEFAVDRDFGFLLVMTRRR